MPHSTTPALSDAGLHARYALGTPEFDTILATPELAEMRAFGAYWQSKLTDARPPLRADIDPVDIPKLLPNVLLVDVIGHPAYDFHYRLIGTAIAAVDGVDYTGSLLSEMVPTTEAFHHIWQHHLDAAAGTVALRRDSMRWVRDNSRDHIDYVILLLPLRHAGDGIETLIGYIHYLVDDLHRPWSF